VPLRTVEPEPWSVGVRFRHQPDALQRYRVAEGSPADDSAIADLPLGDGAWISLVIRQGHLVPARSDTRLRAGDEVLALTDPLRGDDYRELFEPNPLDDGGASR
jgi:cell volume regulation protein A